VPGTGVLTVMSAIARADRQIITRIQNVYLSYGGLLQFLLKPVGARPAGDVSNQQRTTEHWDSRQPAARTA